MNLVYSMKKNRYYSNQDESSPSVPVISFRFLLSLLYSMYTFFAFFIVLLITPFLFITYVGTQVCRRFCFHWLENKYPQLEFVKQMTVRTVVDTHRNQGIITVLLKLNSPCQINFVKNRIQGDIIERSNGGKAMFPHLRTVLTSRWGCYAWERGTEKNFSLNNHISLANSMFKGRLVSDTNIQEYVTDIVSKLMPPEFPPWQITLIPAVDSKSYLLIRLHHLYLSEDKLSLGDLLMLKEEGQYSDSYFNDSSGIMNNSFKNPMVLIRIYDHFCESMTNYWNEFVSAYDPIENPSILKKAPGLTTFVRLVLVTLGFCLRELHRGQTDLYSIVKKESERRSLSMAFMWKCIFNSIEPFNLFVSYLRWVWWIIGKVLSTPKMLLSLLRESPLMLYWLYLMNFAIEEIFDVVKAVYETPRVILEEIFLPEHPCNVHSLQTLSLCGRKVVDWSEKVDMSMVQKIAAVTGANTGEVCLAAAAHALTDYFAITGQSAPDCVVTTCRFMPLQYLLSRTAKPAFGSLCLPLPTNQRASSPLCTLRSLQTSLHSARSHQSLLYLASLYHLDHNAFTSIFPSILARACLYLLSRRYSVIVTLVDDVSMEEAERQLLWGPKVESLMYWRPPQANICLSLTLMTYSKGIRLGVMADALLAPHHTGISQSFSDYINRLASSLSIPPEVTSSSRRQQDENRSSTDSNSLKQPLSLPAPTTT